MSVWLKYVACVERGIKKSALLFCTFFFAGNGFLELLRAKRVA